MILSIQRPNKPKAKWRYAAVLILLDWETFSLHLIHIVQRKIMIFRKAPFVPFVAYLPGC